MSNLYSKIEGLCHDARMNITEMCRVAGVPRGNLTDLKMGRQSGLSAVNLGKIARALNVPVGFFTETPPFDCWDLINSNRAGFLHYVPIAEHFLMHDFHLDLDVPEMTPTQTFVQFIDRAIESAIPEMENGDWIITLRPEWRGRENASEYYRRVAAQGGKRIDAVEEYPQRINDKDLIFALWGDNDEITEEDLNDVRRYADFVAQRKKEKK